jgi:HPt (histidine-containing phosphotransfer) domain-containing protein
MHTTPSTAVLNAAVLRELFEGDEELMREIAELFLKDYPSRIAEVRDALACADPLRLAQAAHSLKGSLGNFGAAGAVEAALGLELMGRRGVLTNPGEALAALERELVPVLEALTAIASDCGAMK